MSLHGLAEHQTHSLGLESAVECSAGMHAHARTRTLPCTRARRSTVGGDPVFTWAEVVKNVDNGLRKLDAPKVGPL